MRTGSTLALLVHGLLLLQLGLAGCDDPIRARANGLMWYRPPPHAPAKPLTVSVDRAGWTALYGIEGRILPSREWGETGANVGRAGRTAAVGTGLAERTILEGPWDNRIGASSNERSASLGISGSTARISSSTEGSAAIGTEP